MNISNRLLPGLLAMGSACAFTTSVHAADLTNFSAINQAEFLALSKDLAATTSHKAMEPAAPLGLSGFDVSGAATMTNIHDTSTWAKVSGDSASNLLQTKLSVSKGLPGGWDVGGFVSKVNSTNVSVSGIHAKYALLEGNVITPAIAMRGSYSRIGESFSQAKSFVGVSWNILLLNLSAEYDRTGKNSSVGVKAGVRF